MVLRIGQRDEKSLLPLHTKGLVIIICLKMISPNWENLVLIAIGAPVAILPFKFYPTFPASLANSETATDLKSVGLVPK